MTAAFRATFADLKLIKTRQCVQIIFEVPQNEFDAAYEVLGGLPNPAAERWFGIAAIAQRTEKETNEHPTVAPQAMSQQGSDKPPAGAKRDKMDWREMQPAAQAALRCEDPTFRAFLREERGIPRVDSPTTAAIAVREICGVESRAELSTNHRKRVIWHQLDSQYLAWKAVEHA